MMYPLLGPGSFVQINDKDRKVETARWRNEYERPIYFVELHDGYSAPTAARAYSSRRSTGN